MKIKESQFITWAFITKLKATLPILFHFRKPRDYVTSFAHFRSKLGNIAKREVARKSVNRSERIRSGEKLAARMWNSFYDISHIANFRNQSDAAFDAQQKDVRLRQDQRP